MSRKQTEHTEVLCRNKKAAHDYYFDEQWEAGVSLLGSEVKSIRQGRANLVDAFVEARSGELWLVGAEISPYPFAHARNHPPRRDRKLLLHRAQIERITAKVREKGYTLIPTELHAKQGRIKATIALAKGKQQHDKRETERKREHEREMRRERGNRR